MERSLPDEDEMRVRILHHLEQRPGDRDVLQVWAGYLAGLLEWGVLDPGVHGRLLGCLHAADKRAVLEVFLSPEYVEQHPDLLRPGGATAEHAVAEHAA